MNENPRKLNLKTSVEILQEVGVTNVFWYPKLLDTGGKPIHNKVLLESTLILLRNSTWKCGKSERRIVQFLQQKPRKATVKSLLNDFKNMDARTRQRIYKSIRRLHRRKIIEIKKVDLEVSQGIFGNS